MFMAATAPGSEIISSPKQRFLHFLEKRGIDVAQDSMFRRALVHRSYASENNMDVDNERLEFLGDSVIALVVSDRLYLKERAAREGKLSKQRAAIVSRNNLGRVGLAIGLGDMILLGVGEDKSGGRERLSTVGSCLEAFVGAVYVEMGVDAAREFVDQFVLNEKERSAALRRDWDSKSLFQEWTQREWKLAPEYKVVESSGPDHQRRFVVEVRIDGKRVATGEGRRKKEAESNAAAEALRIIEENGGFDDFPPA